MTQWKITQQMIKQKHTIQMKTLSLINHILHMQTIVMQSIYTMNSGWLQYSK